MTAPHRPRPRPRPSDTYPPADDVTDRLLYALAVDVAAAHQPGPDGTCLNQQCHGQQGPCWALRTAYRAARAARRPPHADAKRDLTPTEAPPLHPAARGRARVPDPPPGSASSNSADALSSGPLPPGGPAAGPAPAGRPFAVFRRPPAA